MKKDLTTKYIELPGFAPVPFIFIPETSIKRTIVVYGDSFAEAALNNAKNCQEIYSWLIRIFNI